MTKILNKEAKAFYDAYDGEKVTYANYINRIKKKIPYNKAIKPGLLKETREKLKQKREKYREKNPHYNFYKSFEGEKVGYRNFLSKLRSGFTPEQAIIKYSKRNKPKRDRNRLKNIKNKTNQRKTINPTYFYIEITYDKETANIIRNMYNEKLKELENKIYVSLDQSEAEYLQKEMVFLQKQIEIFNSWNS